MRSLVVSLCSRNRAGNVNLPGIFLYCSTPIGIMDIINHERHKIISSCHEKSKDDIYIYVYMQMLRIGGVFDVRKKHSINYGNVI